MRGGGEDVLEHGHAAERPRDLVRAGDAEPAALGGRQGGDVLAAETARVPAVGAMRAGEHAEQGRLAGAVRGRRCRRPRRRATAKSTASSTTSAPKRLWSPCAVEERFAVLSTPSSRRRSAHAVVRHAACRRSARWGRSACSVTTKSSLNLLPAFAFTHCVPMIGPATTFGTGPLVKSTLPAMVVVLSVAIALATAALFVGSPLLLQRGEAGVEQRQRGAELLRPLLAGGLLVAVGELGAADAGERRLIGERLVPIGGAGDDCSRDRRAPRRRRGTGRSWRSGRS